jgi:hypothetical protein
MSGPNEPVLDVARGDAALSRHLRNCLEVLRRRTEDAEFRQLVDDVLAGRRGLREVALSPAFEQVLSPAVEQFAQRYEQLSDAEREQLAADGEQQLSELGERIARER